MGYSENKVRFKDDCCCIKGGRYKITDFSITNGKYDPSEICVGAVFKMDSEGKFCFKIDRKGSEEDAKWFNDRVSAFRNTFGHEAGSLNFAFMGTLELDVELSVDGGTKQTTCVYHDIALAQGHSGATNNWWFGGTTCSYMGDDVTGIENCVSTYGTIDSGSVFTIFRRGGNAVDEVGVSIQHILGSTSEEIKVIK